MVWLPFRRHRVEMQMFIVRSMCVARFLVLFY